MENSLDTTICDIINHIVEHKEYFKSGGIIEHNMKELIAIISETIPQIDIYLLFNDSNYRNDSMPMIDMYQVNFSLNKNFADAWYMYLNSLPEFAN